MFLVLALVFFADFVVPVRGGVLDALGLVLVLGFLTMIGAVFLVLPSWLVFSVIERPEILFVLCERRICFEFPTFTAFSAATLVTECLAESMQRAGVDEGVLANRLGGVIREEGVLANLLGGAIRFLLRVLTILSLTIIHKVEK